MFSAVLSRKWTGALSSDLVSYACYSSWDIPSLPNLAETAMIYGTPMGQPAFPIQYATDGFYCNKEYGYAYRTIKANPPYIQVRFLVTTTKQKIFKIYSIIYLFYIYIRWLSG